MRIRAPREASQVVMPCSDILLGGKSVQFLTILRALVFGRLTVRCRVFPVSSNTTLTLDEKSSVGFCSVLLGGASDDLLLSSSEDASESQLAAISPTQLSRS